MSRVRDFNDPAYKKWRLAVYKRDGRKCQMPGCAGGDKRLNAHHIKCWQTWPALRFVVSNGITLCRTCHDKVSGHETEYENVFQRLVVAPRDDTALRVLMMRYGSVSDQEKT